MRLPKPEMKNRARIGSDLLRSSSMGSVASAGLQKKTGRQEATRSVEPCYFISAGREGNTARRRQVLRRDRRGRAVPTANRFRRASVDHGREDDVASRLGRQRACGGHGDDATTDGGRSRVGGAQSAAAGF